MRGTTQVNDGDDCIIKNCSAQKIKWITTKIFTINSKWVLISIFRVQNINVRP